LLLNHRLRDLKSIKYLIVVLPALVAAALVLLYIADLASNVWMGNNITHKLVGLWISDWRAGGDLLSMSPWVGMALGGLFMSVVAAHVALAGKIEQGLRALLLAQRTRRQKLAWAAGVALIVAAYGAYFQQLSWRTPRSELLNGDPILVFLRQSIDVYDDSYLAMAERLKIEEPRCRADYPKGLAFDKKNVIVIIADSLRSDHMSVYGYSRPTTPFLSELHASGRLRKVEHATSTCAESNCGILSTLFSKTLRRQVPEDFKVYDLLKDQGYKIFFVLSGSHDWHGLREMYGREHDVYFDGRDAKAHSRSDDRVLLEGLERVPAATAPAFFYFHLMSSHLIGIKQQKYRVYQPSEVKNDWDALYGGAYDRETVINNYDNGVTQSDGIIKELFAALDAKGYLRNSIVFILADHGEGLGERGYGHVTHLYEEVIRIPMLIYDEPGVHYGNLKFGTQVDVAPTIVDRLGLPVPGCWQGHSLVRPAIAPVTLHQTTLKKPTYALVYRTDAGRIYKYMYAFLGRREEVYDLTADPREQVNVRDTVDPALLAHLRQEMQRLRSE
jgi:glucan phosphoethanolaminetransferase (alkaline phosphatase superfamily)